MIAHIALFGAAGDLAGRHLLPALASLLADGRLPGGVTLTAADTRDWDGDRFRGHLAARLERHGADVPAAAREALVAGTRYVRADAADTDAIAAAVRGDDPVVAYLALPPPAFPDAVRGLRAAGLPAGSRIAVEKPFGEDQRSARELNALLDDRAYRVDHALGMPAVEEIARAEPAGLVEVLWEETIALEGRAGFYDRAGALRDVLQNHMLQLVAVLLDAQDRSGALRDVRPPAAGDMARRTQRARYAGYAEEEGVDPARGTETFAEVLLEARGTTFRLRAGKALAEGFKGVVLGERRIPCLGEREAYRNVLLDVLGGGSARAVGAAEAEEAWRIVEPVLGAWARDAVPLTEYPRGSAGPPRLQA
jgi:glucose-6-phosphate 1-dehydrogenase